MGFELFEAKGSDGGDLTVSLRASKSIGISTAVGEKFFADNDYAQMYFDEDNQRVGIEPLDEATPNSYKLRRNKQGKGGAVNCRAFLSTYDLNPKETQKYQVTWDDDKELLYFDLEEDQI